MAQFRTSSITACTASLRPGCVSVCPDVSWFSSLYSINGKLIHHGCWFLNFGRPVGHVSFLSLSAGMASLRLVSFLASISFGGFNVTVWMSQGVFLISVCFCSLVRQGPPFFRAGLSVAPPNDIYLVVNLRALSLLGVWVIPVCQRNRPLLLDVGVESFFASSMSNRR